MVVEQTKHLVDPPHPVAAAVGRLLGDVGVFELTKQPAGLVRVDVESFGRLQAVLWRSIHERKRTHTFNFITR